MMRRLLWLGGWILAHGAAVAIATAIDFEIAFALGLEGLLWAPLAFGIINGCCIGGVEAWLLRRLWRYPGWWLVATILATPPGIALAVVVLAGLSTSIGPGQDSLKVFLFGLFVGTVVGIAQYPCLRRHLRRAAMWIAIAGMGRGIGWAAGFSLVISLNFASEVTLSAWGGAVGGAIYGFITGIYLQQTIPTH